MAGFIQNNAKGKKKKKKKKMNCLINYYLIKYYINYLELLATFFGLKCFSRDLSSCNVLLRIDNTTSISDIEIEGGGGACIPHLNN